MEITVTIHGNYSDGQKFSCSVNGIERAIHELEMIEQNEHAFDDTEPTEYPTT